MSLPSFLKTAATPGSVPFFLIGLAVTALVAILRPRQCLWAAGGAVGLGLLYLVLGLPVVANALAGPPAVTDEASAAKLSALVILDGDNRLGRVREAERLAQSPAVRRIWVLGDAWLANRLVADGVDASRLTRVPTTNTRAQMQVVRDTVRPAGPGPVGLVASRLQMPRIAGLARAMDLQPRLFPSAIDTEPPTSGWRRFQPSYVALRTSRDAIYEDVAVLYYRSRGWARPGVATP